MQTATTTTNIALWLYEPRRSNEKCVILCYSMWEKDKEKSKRKSVQPWVGPFHPKFMHIKYTRAHIHLHASRRHTQISPDFVCISWIFIAWNSLIFDADAIVCTWVLFTTIPEILRCRPCALYALLTCARSQYMLARCRCEVRSSVITCAIKVLHPNVSSIFQCFSWNRHVRRMWREVGPTVFFQQKVPKKKFFFSLCRFESNDIERKNDFRVLKVTKQSTIYIHEKYIDCECDEINFNVIFINFLLNLWRAHTRALTQTG